MKTNEKYTKRLKKNKKVLIESSDWLNLTLHTRFMFALHENAKNVAIAIGSAGYFVNIINVSNAYQVSIYKRR